MTAIMGNTIVIKVSIVVSIPAGHTADNNCVRPMGRRTAIRIKLITIDVILEVEILELIISYMFIVFINIKYIYYL